eukprot:4184168-Amphidinium_carterae.1
MWTAISKAVCTNNPVRITDWGCDQANCGPVRITDWCCPAYVWRTDEASKQCSSPVYISSGIFVHTFPLREMPSKGFCRAASLWKFTIFTKDQRLKRCYVPTCQTTKAPECRLLPGLGKASMLQTTHPLSYFLGWGWFKNSRFKQPGHPANLRPWLVTAGHVFVINVAQSRLDTNEDYQCCPGQLTCYMSVVRLQPFEHKNSDPQPCRFLRAATLFHPDLVPYGRDSGPT